MKTRIINLMSLMVALLVFNSNSIAQEATTACKPHEFTVGAIGYANLSLLYAGSNEINKNYQLGVGYSAGILSTYAFNDLVSIAAQANFAQLNSERKDMQPLLPGSPMQNASNTVFANFKKVETYDVIEIPVMVRFTTYASDHVKLYVNAGPSVGFIVNGLVTTSGRSMLYHDLAGSNPESTNTVYSIDGSQNITKTLNTVNLSATGGIGAGYTFGNHCIMLDARYNLGLTNMRTNSLVNGKNNLQTIMLGLGYSYTIFE